MILRSNLSIVSLRACFTHRITRSTQGCRGFTMVEMLIVIGVMLVLSALTMMVIGSATRASEIRQTKNILRILEMAVGEWELVANRDISYGVADQPVINARYDIDQLIIETSGTGPNFYFSNSIFDLLGIIERTAQSRDILADIDPEFLADGKDMDDNVRLGMRDPWDTPIRAIFPGRLWVDTDNPLPRNEDGTIRTLIEQYHGICVSRRILLVSAGPDGEWGSLTLDTAIEDLSLPERDLLDEAADNIYSYEPQRIRPAP